MKKPAALIFNPAAGKGADESDVQARLAEAFDVQVFETSPERDADVCARAALEAGHRLIVASGGDGTVSSVASSLVGTQAVLGVLPLGTANSFAGGLGIPDDLDGALGVLVDGAPRTIDTARANGRPMVLHAAVGFHAATVGETSREAKNRWGLLAYLASAFEHLRETEPFHVELETDEAIIRCSATNVMVANLAPLSTILAQGPAALSPDDGRLDVTIVSAAGIAEAVATGFHLLRTAAQGQSATRDNVGFLPARRLRITATPAQPVLIDGEPSGESPVLIECAPRSLRVMAPRPDTGPPQPEMKLEGLPDLEVQRKR